MLLAPPPDQARHCGRRQIEARECNPFARREARIKSPLRQLRLIDGFEGATATCKLAAPLKQRRRFRGVKRGQLLDRNQVVVQTAPTASREARRAGRAEQIVSCPAARDDLVPQHARLGARQYALRRFGRCCARFKLLLAEPRAPGKHTRRAPDRATLRLRVPRVARTHRMSQAPAGCENDDVLVEERVELQGGDAGSADDAP